MLKTKLKMSFSRCGAATPLLVSFVRLLVPSGVRASVSQCSSNPVVSSSVAAISKCVRNMYIAEERGSQYAPDYRVYFSECLLTQSNHRRGRRSRSRCDVAGSDSSHLQSLYTKEYCTEIQNYKVIVQVFR